MQECAMSIRDDMPAVASVDQADRDDLAKAGAA